MKKERIYGLDLARAVCAILIVIYHYIKQIGTMPYWAASPIHPEFPNGDWGNVTVVSIFFMISGITLLYNYPRLGWGNLRYFWYKRWKSVMPAYLLVWAWVYVPRALSAHTPFYEAEPKYMLLTFIGMDGYLHGYHDNYYIVGEWFLGAILILYLLYPLLLFLYRKCYLIASLGICLAYFINLSFKFFPIMTANVNMITCVFDFWLGMTYLRFRGGEKKRRLFGLIAIPVMFFAFFFRVPEQYGIAMMTLAGFCGLMIMEMLSDILMKKQWIAAPVNAIGAISFEIYLVHHVMMADFAKPYVFILPGSTFSVWQEFKLFLIIFVAVLITAKAFQLLIHAFFSTKLVLWIDKKMKGKQSNVF